MWPKCLSIAFCFWGWLLWIWRLPLLLCCWLVGWLSSWILNLLPLTSAGVKLGCWYLLIIRITNFWQFWVYFSHTRTMVIHGLTSIQNIPRSEFSANEIYTEMVALMLKLWYIISIVITYNLHVIFLMMHQVKCRNLWSPYIHMFYIMEALCTIRIQKYKSKMISTQQSKIAFTCFVSIT